MTTTSALSPFKLVGPTILQAQALLKEARAREAVKEAQEEQVFITKIEEAKANLHDLVLKVASRGERSVSVFTIKSVMKYTNVNLIIEQERLHPALKEFWTYLKNQGYDVALSVSSPKPPQYNKDVDIVVTVPDRVR